ncbi:hypothetical protein NDU88_006834 [Pleurodeles waltl]|uniref:Uncharacterized protein n=1 Tax=Pleurodeles waltl TaxID=8319 RepID=A0AAV7QLX3_PLEWA|nr:hypothetical protein NDU88_006834 [Pleurodeles waltl]
MERDHRECGMREGRQLDEEGWCRRNGRRSCYTYLLGNKRFTAFPWLRPFSGDEGTCGQPSQVIEAYSTASSSLREKSLSSSSCHVGFLRQYIVGTGNCRRKFRDTQLLMESTVKEWMGCFKAPWHKVDKVMAKRKDAQQKYVQQRNVQGVQQSHHGKDVLGRVDGLVPLSRALCNGTGPSGMWNAGGTAVSGGRLVREEWEKELLYTVAADFAGRLYQLQFLLNCITHTELEPARARVITIVNVNPLPKLKEAAENIIFFAEQKAADRDVVTH